MRSNLLLILLFAATASTLANAQQKTSMVTIGTLLQDMVDRDAVTKLPNPSYMCKQFSSYDRASVAKDKPGWYSNDDWSMFITAEQNNGRRELVMMDTEGPGAIVRFWMTFAGKNCGEGILRIYIDDHPEPVVEATAFEILSGGRITGTPLSASVSELSDYVRRGHNLYFPIPYQKSCKVTYQSDNVYYGEDHSKRKGTENVYYNINYRTYPAGTPVESFSMSLLDKYSKTIANVQQKLSLKHSPVDVGKMRAVNLGCTLAQGQSQSFTITGSHAIRQLTMKLSSDDMGDALRRTVMEISFDGEQTAWVPVGDFYGIGYKPLQAKSWYGCVDENNLMSSYWVMPFEKECVITLHNMGHHPVSVNEARVYYDKWKWDDRSMHFGASWHQYTNFETGYNNETRPSDINFTTLKGKGLYVGDAITLYNTVNGWWGEGDEKIYVDGEEFPSHFGTGTEDYYGYAWCRPENFTGHPFISQPDGSGNLSAGYAVNARTRSLDAIPFCQSISVDMEIWHWQQANLNYAPTSIWYMRPGGICTVAKDTEGIAARLAYARSDVVSGKVELSIEAENMSISTVGSGTCYYQTRGGALWSNCAQVFWHSAEPGSKLELDFDSDFSAEVTVAAVMTMAGDYGTVNLYLNGIKIADRINLNGPELKTEKIRMGKAMLNKGGNRLTLETVFPAPGMEKCLAGIDKVFFEMF